MIDPIEFLMNNRPFIIILNENICVTANIIENNNVNVLCTVAKKIDVWCWINIVNYHLPYLVVGDEE